MYIAFFALYRRVLNVPAPAARRSSPLAGRLPCALLRLRSGAAAGGRGAGGWGSCDAPGARALAVQRLEGGDGRRAGRQFHRLLQR